MERISWPKCLCDVVGWVESTKKGKAGGANEGDGRQRDELLKSLQQGDRVETLEQRTHL